MRLGIEIIKRLKEAGFTGKEIAAIDGTVKTTAIYAALERERNPDLPRERSKKYYRSEKYIKRHPKGNRAWKGKNPSKWRDQRNKSKRKRQQETMVLAINNRQPWTLTEIAYLEKYGRTKTIKELALKLGRSHAAIQDAAHIHGISLYSPEKASGRINRTNNGSRA